MNNADGNGPAVKRAGRKAGRGKHAPIKPRAGTGRKSAYRKEFDDMAKMACAKGGFSDALLAKLFGVSKSTVILWRGKHEAFAEACQEGKDIFAVSVAEDALLKRVKGYRYTEDTYHPLALSGDENTGERMGGLEEAGTDESGTGKMVLVKRVRKSVLPDVAAIRFLLVNRSRERWAERQSTELAGKVAIENVLPEETAALLLRVYGNEQHGEDSCLSA